MSFFLNSLVESGKEEHNDEDMIHKHLPLKVFSGHKDEGYAIDWSPLVTGRLVSGVFLILSIHDVFIYSAHNVCVSIVASIPVSKPSIHLV